MRGRRTNLAGRRFGRLIALRDTGGRHKGSVVWECVCDCGNIHAVTSSCLVAGRSRSCGCYKSEVDSARGKGSAGENHPNWKGGKTRTKAGYVRVVVKGGVGKKQKFEHVLVIERFLGRVLRKGETIHHKNGIRHDNRLENLELWDSSHPSGQRMEDKLRWAEEYVRLHGCSRVKHRKILAKS